METKKNEILLPELERNLEQYDIVFLVMKEQKEISYFWKQVCKLKDFGGSGKKVLFMVLEDVDINEDCFYYQISKWDAEKLRDLYYIYEFSDKFRVFSGEDNFGTIFNFIQTGILTWKEAFEALLQ